MADQHIVIDHVTAIVRDAAAVAGVLSRVLGREPVSALELPGMRVLTFRLGSVELHVNEPTAPGPVADALAGHGPCLHHVALACSDLDATIARLGATGVVALGSPVQTAPGLREVFLDPRGTGGLLVQLVERRVEGAVSALDRDALHALVGSLDGDDNSSATAADPCHGRTT